MPEPKISGEKITLFWGFDPDGEHFAVGPWREGDQRAERYAEINNLIVVSVVGEIRPGSSGVAVKP